VRPLALKRVELLIGDRLDGRRHGIRTSELDGRIGRAARIYNPGYQAGSSLGKLPPVFTIVLTLSFRRSGFTLCSTILRSSGKSAATGAG
jgi:hypothetical protein